MQNEMVNAAENNPTDFWKTIGRAGVRNNRKNDIPMEIINDNGEVVKDRNLVFDKWKTVFSDLLNSAPDQQIDTQSVDVMVFKDNFEKSGLFENHFSLSEIQRALGNIKWNRTADVDEIPGEVLNQES